jgi:prepilin peptidase CpaA
MHASLPGADTPMQTVILFLGVGLFAVAAYGDVRTRRIPNELALGIGALGLLRMMLADDARAPLYTLGAAAVVFAVAFLLFRRDLVGGGDVKLLTAAALLIGYHDLLSFLLLMSLCGAFISLAMLTADKLGSMLRHNPRPAMLPVPENSPGTPGRLSVPYGVAIAAAGILVLALQSSLPG